MKTTKYTVKYTTAFKKDYKRAVKRGLEMELLEQVVALLSMGELLPDKNRDHELTGAWTGHRECHILPQASVRNPSIKNFSRAVRPALL